MPSLRTAAYLLSLLAAPYRIGFYRGHHHLSEVDVARIEATLHSCNRAEQEKVVRHYEEAFAALAGTKDGISFASGRMAFYSLMKSLGIGSGDEIIIPGFTCSVVASAIYRTGARPVYADIDPETLGSDAAAIARRITSRTRMIVAQHSFGIPCNIGEIADLARSKGIFLVEDSALALDSRYCGRAVGTFGDAAFFSTDHSKPLNTIIGGMLCSPHHDILDRVRETIAGIPDLPSGHQERIFGRFCYEREYYVPERYPRAILREFVGECARRISGKPPVFLESDYTRQAPGPALYPYPARMPAFLAALGLTELERWPGERQRRHALLREFLRASEENGGDLRIPAAYSDAEKEIVPLRFIFRSRDAALREQLGRHVDTRAMWFLDPVVCSPGGPAALGYEPGTCTGSEAVCSDILNMPCVLPDGWDQRAALIFRGIAAGSGPR